MARSIAGIAATLVAVLCMSVAGTSFAAQAGAPPPRWSSFVPDTGSKLDHPKQGRHAQEGPMWGRRPVAAESGIRACANRERLARGLDRLRPSRPLARAARLHARNMARLGFFDHTDPQGRGVWQRLGIFDRGRRFAYVGENIAAGYDSAASACRSWMGSSGHRRNILDPDFTHVGGGFARGGPYGRYYVQVFGAPR